MKKISKTFFGSSSLHVSLAANVFLRHNSEHHLHVTKLWSSKITTSSTRVHREKYLKFSARTSKPINLIQVQHVTALESLNYDVTSRSALLPP